MSATTIKRPFETKQAWLNELVRLSRTGAFPAMVKRGIRQQCLYTTEDGRRCAVGVLFPTGTVSCTDECNGLLADELFYKRPELAAYLPDGVSQYEAVDVQDKHDRVAFINDGAWNHDQFVSALLATVCFKGMVPDEN
jgi:hypothetical protein